MTTQYKPLLTRGVELQRILRALTRKIREVSKKCIPAASAFILGASAGVAVAQQMQHPPAQAADRFAQGLLWRVDKAPDVAPSYLYGTLHVSDERIVQIPPAVSRLLNSVGTVATEVTFERRDIARITTRIYLPVGEYLSERMESHEFAALREMLVSSGVAAANVDRLTPFGAIAFLVARPNPRRSSLDLQIFNAARANRIKTIGLESVDEQFASVREVGDAQLLAELRSAARAPKEFMQGIDRMIHAYIDEDIDGLATRVGARTSGAAGEVLIERRNVRMLARVRPIFDSGSALVAVGAAHLGGPEGLLVALHAAGYTVTRMPLD